MANSKLKLIVAEAKKIRKAKPSIKWTNAIKEASKKIGSYTIQESAAIEKRNKKRDRLPKKLKVTRRDDGTFLKFKKIAGVDEITTAAAVYKKNVNELAALKSAKAPKAAICKKQKQTKISKNYLNSLL